MSKKNLKQTFSVFVTRLRDGLFDFGRLEDLKKKIPATPGERKNIVQHTVERKNSFKESARTKEFLYWELSEIGRAHV